MGISVWGRGDGFDAGAGCGDAASLIDPLQGHGIDMAMWSGIFAAKQTIHCFEKNDFSSDFMKQYDSVLYEKMGRHLSVNYFLMRILLRFSFLFRISPPQRLSNWLIRIFKI